MVLTWCLHGISVKKRKMKNRWNPHVASPSEERQRGTQRRRGMGTGCYTALTQQCSGRCPHRAPVPPTPSSSMGSRQRGHAVVDGADGATGPDPRCDRRAQRMVELDGGINVERKADAGVVFPAAVSRRWRELAGRPLHFSLIGFPSLSASASSFIVARSSSRSAPRQSPSFVNNSSPSLS
ncbi:hypothetical protein E2562_001504 [Oryza meyeriana var. granulata]|uniref:Uncharacterized protein n=1 Tax=Oryza meyeriana var. granulata TaxID=110450 RepID=A0A6G1DDR8_9ORYZ|nr:hypothetical protein E2562_001504 [Oryza meyeriana var. granulata]